MREAPDHIEIFTDGSCLKNPDGPGAWAFVVTTPDGEVIEQSEPDASTTNNKMEMTAALQALSFIRATQDLTYEPKIVLYTDSEYVKKGMTEWMAGWKRRGWTSAKGDPIANQDLWRELDFVSNGLSVDWRWVRGHAGHEMNERVDKLAKTAAKTQQGVHNAFHLDDEPQVDDATPKRQTNIVDLDACMTDEVLATAVRNALLVANGKIVRIRQSLAPADAYAHRGDIAPRAVSRNVG